MLHITYLSQENEEDFFELVENHGTVVQHSWQKLPNINKWMLLVRMSTIE